MAGRNGNGNFFNFNGNGRDKENGDGFSLGPGDGIEGEDDHEHEFANIAQTPNISAFEEVVHQVITLEFHDRGLTLDFSYEEAEELTQVVAEIKTYLQGKPTIEP